MKKESIEDVIGVVVKKILDDNFKPSDFSGGAPIVLDPCGPYIAATIFCGKLPKLAYSNIEKLYWQNDIDGVNNLIDKALARGDSTPQTYRFAMDSYMLRRIGINIPDSPEHIDITSIRTHDVVFAIDAEGDLVRATVA